MPATSEASGDQLIAIWAARARRSESAHYQTAARYARYHTVLTSASVVLSSVTASGLFASRGSSAPYRVTFGVLGILAAVVAGIDRGQRFAERSEQHRSSGAQWAVIVNATEELTLRPSSQKVSERDFDELRKRMDETTAHSPQLPQTAFVRNEVEDTYLYPHYAPKLQRTWKRLWLWPRPLPDSHHPPSAVRPAARSTEPAAEQPASDPPRSTRRSAGRKIPPAG
jgi:hypothetical protein